MELKIYSYFHLDNQSVNRYAEACRDLREITKIERLGEDQINMRENVERTEKKAASCGYA